MDGAESANFGDLLWFDSFRLLQFQCLKGRSSHFPVRSNPGGKIMSAPSRRPEIRRRRTRKEKIEKLRKRLTAASGEDRKRLEQKLHRLSLVSPANQVKTA